VSADHGRIKLTDDPIREEGEKKRGVATVAGVLTYGLASNAIHGSEASINPTRTLTAHTDGTVHVMSSVKRDSDTRTYDK